MTSCMWHCAYTWLCTWVFTWECCTLSIALCSFSFLPNGLPVLVQGDHLLVHRGLVSMNYSQSKPHIPHGHCFWLKLEVLSPLSIPLSISMESPVKKNNVGGDHLLSRLVAISLWRFTKQVDYQMRLNCLPWDQILT